MTRRTHLSNPSLNRTLKVGTATLSSAKQTSAKSPPRRPAQPPLQKRKPTWFEREWLSFLLKPLPLMIAVACIAQWRALERHHETPAEKDPRRALTLALQERGLTATPNEVFFFQRPTQLGALPRLSAVIRGKRGRTEPADIFLMEPRFSPEGHLVELGTLYNLTDTSAADEQSLTVGPAMAAWAVAQEGAIVSIHYADFRGERVPEGWGSLQHAQNALTNLQDTGRFAGIGRRSFRLEPTAQRVLLGFGPDALWVDADSHRALIPMAWSKPLEAGAFLIEQTAPKARPGNLVTWAVDRVRALSWFGDTGMQWLKAMAFSGVDEFEQIVETVAPKDATKSIAEELGTMFAAPSEATDPETGWPPPPMAPLLYPPVRGEGQWVLLDKDPFVGKSAGAPQPFAFSFIRVSQQPTQTQVYVLLWDPRQVALHAVSGSQEPKSATGETGSGMIPRKPEVMQRLVGAFNGGFQTIHGEFGMMADRILYVPPKPFAATVAELADGSTGFGTWPEEASPIPVNLISFRQNMTPLIADGRINPYQRRWWGGVPPGWKEELRTVRSGLCTTQEGFVGYFYGYGLDPDMLAHAMRQTRCDYAMHLDMNAGHTGFEFYQARPKGQLPHVGPLVESWQARGNISGLANWEFIGRRLTRNTGLMNFPRYINPDARDFFYLTLRPVLPGAALVPIVQPPEAGEGEWRVHGLPQHGWPYAIATTSIRPDTSEPDLRIGLIKLDPQYLQLSDTGGTTPLVAEFRIPPTEGNSGQRLWHDPANGFTVAIAAPTPTATLLVAGFSPHELGADQALAALCVDEDHMLVYARLTSARPALAPGKQLTSLLKHMGCQTILLLERPLGTIVGDLTDSLGSAESKAKRVLFFRSQGPGARRIFPDTPVVPPARWAPIQRRRTRVATADR